MNKSFAIFTFMSAMGIASFANVAQAVVPTDAKYGGACAYTLAAKGEKTMTDCKVNWTDPKEHTTYCFGDEKAKENFASDISKHKKLADAAFAKAGTDHGAADGHDHH